MNINPLAKTILCYGDSNTYGQRSDDVHKGRWPIDVRWTGQLQSLLGEDYNVIEEGLSSRTTNLEYDRKLGRNGRTYLIPCLQSHTPIDLTILMLGTNDLKNEFHRSAADISDAVSDLVDDIRSFAKGSEILVVSPIHINDSAEYFADLYSRNYSAESVQKSRNLAVHLQQVATQKECLFFDAATVAVSGDDGLHLSMESHSRLAAALHECILAR